MIDHVPMAHYNCLELNEEEEGLIKGYKRRCVLETRAVKAKIAQGLSPAKWALTAEEREKAAQDAVKSLRDKYVSHRLLAFRWSIP